MKKVIYSIKPENKKRINRYFQLNNSLDSQEQDTLYKMRHSENV